MGKVVWVAYRFKCGSKGLNMDILKALSEREDLLAAKLTKMLNSVRVAVHEIWPTTIQKLIDDLNIVYGSFQSNVTEDLSIKRVPNLFQKS